MNEKFFKKIDLKNFDGSAINIPDVATFNMLVEHTRNHYPELYKKFFDSPEISGLRSLSLSDSDDVDVHDAYVNFVGNLDVAIILPDGSELLSPLKKVVPVTHHQPKTLEQLINGTLNIGQIYQQYEAQQEAEYNEQYETDLFAEVLEMAKNDPDWGQTIYDELAFANLKSNIINNNNTLQSGNIPESVLDSGQRSSETDSSGDASSSSKNNPVEDVS